MQGGFYDSSQLSHYRYPSQKSVDSRIFYILSLALPRILLYNITKLHPGPGFILGKQHKSEGVGTSTMDTDSSILFLVLIALILGGGYFAAAETAFASVNPMRIRHRAEEGEKKAQRAEYVLEHFNKALSTLLIGNNIMHIGTASIATYLVTKLWGEGYTAYSTLVTTIVVFLVSEMIPKQFAKDRPEATALFFAPSLCLLMKVLTPVSFFFDSLSDRICRLLKVPAAPTVTEDELMEMIDSLADTEEGGQQRSELLHSALEFDDITVRQIMTPLGDLICVEETMTESAILDIVRTVKYSRLPVYQGSRENIVGILDVRSYIKTHLSAPGEASVRKLMKPIMSIGDSRRIDEVFDEMTQSRTHLCAVRDDAGTFLGIITMEDILEELVGEIWDEQDPIGKEAAL